MLVCMINTVTLCSDARERCYITRNRVRRLVQLRRESGSGIFIRGRTGLLQDPEGFPGKTPLPKLSRHLLDVFMFRGPPAFQARGYIIKGSIPTTCEFGSARMLLLISQSLSFPFIPRRSGDDETWVI